MPRRDPELLANARDAAIGIEARKHGASYQPLPGALASRRDGLKPARTRDHGG